MTDTDICEAYFKALGWKYFIDWMPPYNAPHLDELPNILESFSAFREHVLERMGEDGFKPHLTVMQMFIWWPYDERQEGNSFKEQIIDNHILRAAVLAATRYFKSKEK